MLSLSQLIQQSNRSHGVKNEGDDDDEQDSLSELVQQNSQSKAVKNDDDDARDTVEDKKCKKRSPQTDDDPSQKRIRTTSPVKEESNDDESSQPGKRKRSDSLYSSSEEESDGEVEFGRVRSEENAFQKNYAKSVHALYSINGAQPTPEALKMVNEALVPIQKQLTRVIPQVEKFQPRTRAVKRGRKFEVITETVEDARYRVFRKIRHHEKDRMKSFWKRRTVDYTKEEDVGGVIKVKARRLLEAKIRREEQQKKRRRSREEKKEEEKKKAEEEAERQKNLEDEDNESVAEQNELLEKLTQNMITEVADDSEQKEQEKLREEAMIPFRDRMEFWEYGKATPYKKDLEFDWFHEQTLISRPATEATEEEEGLKVHFKSLLKDGNGRGDVACPRYYFPLNQTKSVGGTLGRYTHWRHVRCMAARYLCGGAGNLDLENRFIRALHSNTIDSEKKPLAFYNQKRSLFYATHGHGASALLFLQKTWRDPLEVAKELGLVGDGLLLMTGRTMKYKRILAFLKARRANVEKNFPGRKRPLTHKKLEDREELEDEDAGEPDEDREAEEVAGDNGAGVVDVTPPEECASDVHNNLSSHDNNDNSQLLDQPTSGGVVADFHPSSTMNQYHRNHRKESKFTLWREEALDALVLPTTIFAHVPGTTPSIPSFPLDPLGVEFGPVDRHASFYHKSCSDDVAYNLTMSTLLSRVARTRLQKKADRDGMEDIQYQLQKFVQEYVKINHTNYYKYCANLSRHKVRDLPLVQFYRGLMGYCSFYANASIQLNSFESAHGVRFSMKREEDHRVVDDSDDDDFDKESDTGNFHEVADEIYKFCRERVKHNGLIRFPRLRVTYALALVCRSLPRSAAEILSRPMDDSECRTPLDIIKRTLEHMEENQMICERKKYEGDGSVLTGELEYLMHDAADIFEDCVKIDSVNIDYHLWRIGALAACLLLCSGNMIGSGACLFPSTRKRGNVRYFHDTNLSHEVRPKMPKFNDVRLELSTAVKLLFVLARHQEGPRVHLAISSLLEWRQVIALLAGNSLLDSSEEIQKLHRFHMLKWGLNTKSSCSREFMKHRQESESLSYLAQTLENDPDKIENWRRFAWALGPLGSNHNSDDGHAHRAECLECRHLREPRVIDHQSRSTERTKPSWWGTHRGWWVLDLLQMETLNHFRNQYKTEAVMQKLEKLMPELAHESTCFEAFAEHSNFVDPIEKEQGWLPSKADIRAERGGKSDEERSSLYESELPESFLDTINQPEKDLNCTRLEIPGLSGPNATKLEVLCYKVLILCHLHDLTHQCVEGYLYPLIRASFNNSDLSVKEDRGKEDCDEFRVKEDCDEFRVKEDCDEFRVLLWVCSMGLNVPWITRNKYNRKHAKQKQQNIAAASVRWRDDAPEEPWELHTHPMLVVSQERDVTNGRFVEAQQTL